MTKVLEKGQLFISIKQLIDQSKHQIAASVNAMMSMMYWQIGRTIHQEILKNKRTEYGKEIFATLSRKLSWSHIKLSQRDSF